MKSLKTRAAILVILTAILSEACLATAALGIRNAGYGRHFEPYQPTANPVSLPEAKTTAFMLLSKTMNSVTKRESFDGGVFPTDFDALRTYVKHHGVLCAGMAYLYHGYLDRAGIPNRIVQFTTELGRYSNTHVTVEVFIDGKWIILDPTFHIRPEFKGKSLSAQDLMNLYYNNESSKINLDFLGNVAYPARTGRYYIKYNLLPRYVYYTRYYGVIGHMKPSDNIFLKALHVALLPAMYFNIISYYILPNNPEIAANMAQQYANATQLYFMSSVIIPIIMILIFIISVYGLIFIIRRR